MQTDVTNPRGFVDRYVFDTAGYPVSHTEALGTALERTTTTTRDATSERVTSTTDALGRETDIVYDMLGNFTSVTRLAGTATPSRPRGPTSRSSSRWRRSPTR